MIGRQASVRGVAVGSVRMHRDLGAFVEEYGIRPVIEQRIPFVDLPAAYRDQTSTGVFGKTVIIVR
jgi:NADPH:quinone reductase-like Zn-dependent oxidoreductase